jgi:hypothetical protein
MQAVAAYRVGAVLCPGKQDPRSAYYIVKDRPYSIRG